MSAGHTPGPWAVHPLKSAWAYVVPQAHLRLPIGGAADRQADTTQYAQHITYLALDSHRHTRGCALANARLIAAAPDLLKVLQELQESASYWSEYDVPLGIVERIHAAIQKATGAKP